MGQMAENKLHVAVVDDDESFASALVRLLLASGSEAIPHASAEAFPAAASLPAPDCLTLDLHLPGMTGADLRRRLRELGNEVPVIFITAHDAPEFRLEAERAGCAAFFAKPVRGQLLVAAIHQACGSLAVLAPSSPRSKPRRQSWGSPSRLPPRTSRPCSRNSAETASAAAGTDCPANPDLTGVVSLASNWNE